MRCVKRNLVGVLISGLSVLFAQALLREECAAAPSEDIGQVSVEIFEGIPSAYAWDFPPAVAGRRFLQPAFGFVGLPRKYSSRAVIADRSATFLIRAVATIELSAGEHRVLLRSRGGARLFVDGQLVATTRFLLKPSNAHGEVPESTPPAAEGIRPLPTGHSEQLATLRSSGSRHVFVLQALVGSDKSRQDVGELSVSIAREDGMVYVLAPDKQLSIPLTDDGWQQFAAREQDRLAAENMRTRQQAGRRETAYWRWRHELARTELGAAESLLPEVSSNRDVNNEVDLFIVRRLEDAGKESAPLVDDFAFLRRVSLDTVGVIPSPEEIEGFLADPPETRRRRAIDRLLADRRWADPWVSYWQDVLAENPGILKPMLNNTGPFRWWLYESFLDNKPLDRFATELVMMEGSTYYGGPAGFALATENDVPMAAKAHILGQALLAVEMKCARCHDAPHHDVDQQDLFSIAAMLKRGPQQVPESSTIPGDPARVASLLVEVTLKPGASVAPEWPFGELTPADDRDFPEGVLRNPSDPRERLAALVTWPRNERFAKVMVNRLWKRYLGRGLVEPVDDWPVDDGPVDDGQDAEASHPELLDWLARELISSGYDLKHVARLVLNSQTYQRAIRPPIEGRGADASSGGMFASPARRRMTAEQLVDSLFAASGKSLDSEPLTLDPDGRRSVNTFQNLGIPRRAWEFTSLSNERDRPSLAMPRSQSIVDVLKTFGWRESRQDPLSVRDDTPTVQQPAMLANSIVTRRVAGLSDGSKLTELCLQAVTPEQLAQDLILRILSRLPSEAEIELIAPLLSAGFDRRIVSGAVAKSKRNAAEHHAVSWSNHLSVEANKIKLAMERSLREGDPPTDRLDADWRKRAESVIWVLFNTPEFVFVP